MMTIPSVHKGKLALFGLIVLLTLGIVGSTAPYIIGNIRLGLDLRGGFEVLYQMQPVPGQKIDDETVNGTVRVLERRIDKLGVSEPKVDPEGEGQDRRIRLQLAGVKNSEEARKFLGTSANLTFRKQDGTILLQGSDVKAGSAKVGRDEIGNPKVYMNMEDPKKFEKVTTEMVGQPLFICMDEACPSSPMVREPISGGEVEITGLESKEEAKNLRDLINGGALPVALKEIQSQTVDATLGSTVLQKGVMAGIYAIVAIFVFMLGYYRLPGFIAVVTLIAYSYLVLLCFYLLGVHLTMPGIAAYILGIGIAVDANIIMSERIKEELRLGKPLPLAVRAGSKRSFLTIFDAHVTTLICGGVLFSVGQSMVKGFAVSLITGILVSFLTAVAMSRIMMTLLVRSRAFRNSKWLGVQRDEIQPL
ncbi:protein translocase subunit SecD [Pasteuria penetrans]|uniref:protein translocase subunit SecD n=1 Tax=Pasteuria penetrans TaxID=86005 RepID=UPI0011EBE709|nr:protein translocase subunit SecD [Pasteuria penetrans]